MERKTVPTGPETPGVFRIGQSLERTRADVQTAFERVGITPEDGDGDGDRIDGAIIEDLVPSTWVVVDLAAAAESPGTLFTVEVRDRETGGQRETAIADSTLRTELIEALEAVSGREVLEVPPVDPDGKRRTDGEWGPTRWEFR